jgi:hypothetical protein
MLAAGEQSFPAKRHTNVEQFKGFVLPTSNELTEIEKK